MLCLLSSMDNHKRILIFSFVSLLWICASHGFTTTRPITDPCNLPEDDCVVNDMVAIPNNCTWFRWCIPGTPGSPNHWIYQQCNQDNATSPVCFRQDVGACDFCALTDCFLESDCSTATPMTEGTLPPFDSCDVDSTCTWANTGDIDGDPYNCSIFYTCVAMWDLQPQTCPPNQLCFDMSIGVCNYCSAQGVQCKAPCPHTSNTEPDFTRQGVTSPDDVTEKYATGQSRTSRLIPHTKTHYVSTVDPGSKTTGEQGHGNTKDPGNDTPRGPGGWGTSTDPNGGNPRLSTPSGHGNNSSTNFDWRWLIFALIVLILLIIILLLIFYIVCKKKNSQVYPEENPVLIDAGLTGYPGPPPVIPPPRYEPLYTNPNNKPPINSVYPGAAAPLPPIPMSKLQSTATGGATMHGQEDPSQDGAFGEVEEVPLPEYRPPGRLPPLTQPPKDIKNHEHGSEEPEDLGLNLGQDPTEDVSEV